MYKVELIMKVKACSIIVYHCIHCVLFLFAPSAATRRARLECPSLKLFLMQIIVFFFADVYPPDGRGTAPCSYPETQDIAL